MAKIYETKEDFERDKLKEQASALHMDAERQSHGGLAFAASALIAESIRSAKPETRGWMTYLSWALIVPAFVQMVRSWFTSTNAHTLDLQHDRMGPERVVLPPDIAPNALEAHQECGCKLKKYAVSAPTSLLDQAQKTGFPPMRE